MRRLTSLRIFITCFVPLLPLWLLPVPVLSGPHGHGIADRQLPGQQLLALLLVLLPALPAARTVCSQRRSRA